MRTLSVICAAILLAGGLPAAGHADGTAPATGASCHCPKVVHRPVRHLRRHVRYRRHWRPVRAAPPLRPVMARAYYDPPIPSPWDPAYDRAMTLHFRSPPVTGAFLIDPGAAPTPPVVGIKPFHVAGNGLIYELDGETGQYIALAPYDAARAYPVAGLPAPPKR
jgi:hypothetical protein